MNSTFFFNTDHIFMFVSIVSVRGIGMMEDLSGINPPACHVDTRGDEPYIFDWWHGDESRHIDWTKDSGHTFSRGTVFPGEQTQPNKNSVKVTLEFDDHQYSGLLEEM